MDITWPCKCLSQLILALLSLLFCLVNVRLIELNPPFYSANMYKIQAGNHQQSHCLFKECPVSVVTFNVWFKMLNYIFFTVKADIVMEIVTPFEILTMNFILLRSAVNILVKFGMVSADFELHLIWSCIHYNYVTNQSKIPQWWLWTLRISSKWHLFRCTLNWTLFWCVSDIIYSNYFQCLTII